MQTSDTTNSTPSPAAAQPFGLSSLNVKPRKSPQLVQVVNICDATGSSAKFTVGINAILHAQANELPQRLAQVSFGLVASRDVDCGESDETLLCNGSYAELHSAVDKIKYIGGADADETHFWSVRDAVTGYSWDEGPMRRKAIVLIGSSDSKPLPDMTLDQLVMQLANKRITVFVVAPRDANLKMLAEMTDGLYFELSNEPSASEVQRLIQRLTASMTQTLSAAPAVDATTVAL